MGFPAILQICDPVIYLRRSLMESNWQSGFPERGRDLSHLTLKPPGLGRGPHHSTIDLLREAHIIRVPLSVKLFAYTQRLGCRYDRSQQGSRPFGIRRVAHFERRSLSTIIPKDSCFEWPI